MPALHGFIVLWPLATPTIGLSKSPSPNPTARSIARLGERATPCGDQSGAAVVRASGILGGDGRSSARGALRIIGAHFSTRGYAYTATTHAGPSRNSTRSPSSSARSRCAGTGSCTWSASCCSSCSASRRARQQMLTGWRPRDVDDMLLLRRVRRDPRRPARLRAVLQAALLSRAPARDLRGLARRHELPRRLPRRAGRAVVLRAAPPQGAGSTSPISSRRLCPLGLGGGTPRQFHQRRARRAARPTCRGRWCSRRSTTCRAIRRSSTSSASRACCCSSSCGSTRRGSARAARCPGCS